MEDLWLVVLATGGLLVRVGMALYGSGLARSKNAAGMLARHLCDFCIATLAFWAVGGAIWLQKTNAYLGLDPSLLFGNGRTGMPAGLVLLMMVLIGTGVVIGAIGERSRFAVSGVLSLVLAAVLIPVVGHWGWMGFLYRWGYVDLGGAGTIHFACGVCAAVAAMVVGPRTGKYNRDGSSNGIPGHNVPLAVGGVLLMLAGWVPYLLSAAVVHNVAWQGVAMKTLVAAAAGGLVALWYARTRYGKVDIGLLCDGLLGGLVAISAGAHVLHPGWALLVGAVAGLVVPMTAILLDLRFKLDDPTSSVAIHGVAGAWGVLAAGLLAGSPAGILRTTGVQAVALLVIGLAVALVTAGTLLAVRAMVGLRSREADEYDGLDLSEHDLNAYPDFQQTMIKSYHLREA